MKRQKILDMAKNIEKMKQKQRKQMLGNFKQNVKKKKRILSDFEIQKIHEIENKRRELLSEIYQEDDINKISLLIDNLVKQDNLNKSLSILKNLDLETLKLFLKNYLSQDNQNAVDFLNLFLQKIEKNDEEKNDEEKNIENDNISELFSDDSDDEGSVIDLNENNIENDNISELFSDDEDDDDDDEYEYVPVKKNQKIKRIDSFTKEEIQPEIIVPKKINLPDPEQPKFKINQDCYLQELTKPWIKGYKYTIVKQIGKLNDNDRPLSNQSFIYGPSKIGNPYSKEWYTTNKNFDRLLCRTDKPPIKSNSELIIYNENNEPVKLQIVYVLSQNRTIEYGDKVHKLRKEYMNRSQMTQSETISKMLSENIHEDESKEIIKKSRYICKKLLTSINLNESLEDFLYEKSDTILNYFTNVSKISVLFTDNNFKHLKKSKSEPILLTLNIEEILEHVFQNPSISQKTKESIIYHYNNKVEINVEILGYKLYQNTYGLYKRLKPMKFDNVFTDFCTNKIKKNEEIIYYEDPDTMKIYCFTFNEIKTILEKKQYLNPFTQKKFTESFIEYLKQIIKTFNLLDEKNKEMNN
jgi:hypothetical protein